MSTDPVTLERTRSILVSNPTLSFAEARGTAVRQLDDEATTLHIEELIAASKADIAAEKAERARQGRVMDGTASQEDINASDDAGVRAEESLRALGNAQRAEAAAQRERIRDALKAGEKFDPSTMVRP